MIKTLKDIDVENKKVILRVDYNVSINDGIIASTKRIDESFKTLDYLISKNAKVIILSHFGKVKIEADKERNTLKPVFDYISGLGKYNIRFCPTPMGSELDSMVNTLRSGELLLVENTRFLDLEGNLESGCDIQLSMYWASLADVYIDDAFGSMHRKHASITGIPKYLPSAVGFLVENEINNIDAILKNPEHPFVAIMGGAKLDDKINLMYSLLEKCDYILLGGGIANTFLMASGYNVGASLVSKDAILTAKNIMLEFKDKIILPKDVITSPSYSDTIYEHKIIQQIEVDDVIGDIGSAAIENYKRIIESAKTIFINGTVGMYEKLEFGNGTQEILNIVANARAKKIVGGGDALSALAKFKLTDKMDFVSTGGGATLQYIADGTLPGIEVVNSSNENLN